MRRVPLYSAKPPLVAVALAPYPGKAGAAPAPQAPPAAAARQPKEERPSGAPVQRTSLASRVVGTSPARLLALMALTGLLSGAGAAWLVLRGAGMPAPLTQADIDAAVLHTLEEQTLPAPTVKAYEAIAPSVVRVIGLNTEADQPVPSSKAAPHGSDERGKPADDPPSIGTGVVILENGTILTNLHVVRGARRLKVEFHNGEVSEADLVSVDAANDLAVIRASRLPDDLQPATLRSASDLKPGDAVMAVGFPFGIGPSASAGVVSGLKREFRSPRGKSVLSNLIQFDAAANPGNSGGPLVTMEGEVVGIVTAILNPSEQRTFIGIGFAVPIDNAAAAVGLPPF